MKKMLLLLLGLGLILTACNIDSPYTATDQWFEYLKNQQYNKAADILVKIDKHTLQPLTQAEQQQFIVNFKKTYGKLTNYSVDNVKVFSPEELKQFGVLQGYWVFYTQKTEKKGEETSHKLKIVTINNTWKIIVSEID